MALEKFIPTSPDENIQSDSDMATAKFGHLNTIVDALNSGFVQRVADISASSMGAIVISGETSKVLISKDYITNRGGGDNITNTAYGENAFRDHVSGISNTAIGYNAFTLNQTGESNTVLGRAPMYFTVSGSNNTALGTEALVLAPTSTGNTIIGSKASQLASAIGNYNTIIGDHAMRYDDGENNTVVGAYTSANDTSGSVILGRSAQATADNQFVVGSSSVNAGTVITETNTSTKVWNVKINGVDHKILLA